MLAWLKKHVRPVLLVLAGLSLVPAYLHAYTLIGPTDIPTVLLGDKIIVNSAAYNLKLPYSNVTLFRSGLPKRGDFVLLRVPHNSRLINEKRAEAGLEAPRGIKPAPPGR
jgi:signal peptidase I